MRVRILSGFVVALIFAVVVFSPPFAMAILVLFATITGLYEFGRALRQKDIHIDLYLAYVGALLLVLGAYSSGASDPLLQNLSDKAWVFISYFSKTFLIAGLLYLFTKFIFGKGKPGTRMEDISHTLLSIAYIPLLLSFAVLTRVLDRGLEYTWFIIIGSSVTDVFAYFVGVKFGKHKIVPDISPKKTVEGSIGGMLGCMLVMVAYGILFVNRMPGEPIHWLHFAAIGLLCGIVSQLGDWTASAFKRITGIKDFGRLIPGHGGIMDRVDSFLFVAPTVYIYIELFLR